MLFTHAELLYDYLFSLFSRFFLTFCVWRPGFGHDARVFCRTLFFLLLVSLIPYNANTPLLFHIFIIKTYVFSTEYQGGRSSTFFPYDCCFPTVAALPYSCWRWCDLFNCSGRLITIALFYLPVFHPVTIPCFDFLFMI